jgi:hypothetical protein
MIELNFEEQIENKLEVNSKKENRKKHKVTQFQLHVTFLSEIKILSFTNVRKVIKFSRTLVCRVIPDFL